MKTNHLDMVRLRHTEDLSLPRSARSYIDSCATEFHDADDNTKIAEIAYRLKRGADLLPIFIEDIRQHMEHPAYRTYEDIARSSIASYIDILRTGSNFSLATSHLADRMKFPALFRVLTEEILYRYWEQPVYDQNIDSDMVECHFDNVHYDYNEIAARFKDAPNAKREFFKYLNSARKFDNGRMSVFRR